MKPIVFLSIVLFSINAFAASAEHYNFTNHSWELQQLPGLANIDSSVQMVAAGSYAWAKEPYASATISFYNGKEWKNAQAIAGMLDIKAIYPAYPVTGKFPNAWAIGSKDHFSKTIAFFDGTKWKPTKIQNTDYSSIDIKFFKASAGHAWIIAAPEDGTGYAFTQTDLNNSNNNPNDKNIPTQFPALATLPDINYPFLQDAVAYNDNAPYLFVLGQNSSYNSELLRIDANNQVKVLKTFNTNKVGVTVREGELIVGYEDENDNVWLYYSKDNGDSWQQIASKIDSIIVPIGNFDKKAKWNINSGILCGRNINGSTQLYCINLNDQHPTWKTVNPPTSDYCRDKTQVVTDKDGAWILVFPDQGALPVCKTPMVYRYNIADGSGKDANITSIAKSLFPYYRVVNGHLLLTGQDTDGNLASFEFNDDANLTMTKAKINDIASTSYVYMSIAGFADPDAYPFLATDTNTNVWVYTYQ